MAIQAVGGGGPHASRRSAAEDGVGAAILLRAAKPRLQSMIALFGIVPGRRKIAAPPPLRAAAAHGTERPLGRPPARPPGIQACPGCKYDTGVNEQQSAFPPLQISDGLHEAHDILLRDLPAQMRPQFGNAKFAEVIVEIAQAGRKDQRLDPGGNCAFGQAHRGTITG